MDGFVAAEGRGGGAGREGERLRPAMPGMGGLPAPPLGDVLPVGEVGSLPFAFSVATAMHTQGGLVWKEGG